MILNKLIEDVTFIEVWDVLKDYDYSESENIDGYKDVLFKLKNMEPIGNEDMKIQVKYLKSEDYYSVDGKKKGEAISYGLDFVEWSRWLGMEVDNPENLNEGELVAYILWEMTFHGFREEVIKEEKDELIRRSEDIDENNIELKESDLEIKEDLPEEERREIEFECHKCVDFLMTIQDKVFKEYFKNKYDMDKMEIMRNVDRLDSKDKEIVIYHSDYLFDELKYLYQQMDYKDEEDIIKVENQLLDKLDKIRDENIERYRDWLLNIDDIYENQLKTNNLIEEQ